MPVADTPTAEAPPRDSTLYEGVVAISAYAVGQLVKVRLYPIDLRANAPPDKRGAPVLATKDEARRILMGLQSLSAPFGTRIDIEGNTGVIKLE